MLGTKAIRRLKAEAVPTIFSFAPPKQQHTTDPGSPEAYLTRSGITRAKRRCRGRSLSRDLCMCTMLLSNYPCTPKISSREHHECYRTKKSEPDVLSSSNNCISCTTCVGKTVRSSDTQMFFVGN